MSQTLRELRALHGEHDTQRFIEERSFPIIDGRSLTFVYRGQADSVSLHHWIHGLASDQPFQQVGPSLWMLELDLPPASRLEYKLGIQRGMQRQMIEDPLNPQVARNPFGNNSVAYNEGYEIPTWATEDAEAREGTIETLQVPSLAFDGDREVSVYVPPRFRPRRRYPLLIAHDGLEYVEFSNLKIVLDNLIERLEIPPMIVALTQSPDRMNEYADDPRHAEFLVDDLLPELEDRYPLVEHPSGRGPDGCELRRSGFARLRLASAGDLWQAPAAVGVVPVH